MKSGIYFKIITKTNINKYGKKYRKDLHLFVIYAIYRMFKKQASQQELRSLHVIYCNLHTVEKNVLGLFYFEPILHAQRCIFDKLIKIVILK